MLSDWNLKWQKALAELLLFLHFVKDSQVWVGARQVVSNFAGQVEAETQPVSSVLYGWNTSGFCDELFSGSDPGHWQVEESWPNIGMVCQGKQKKKEEEEMKLIVLISARLLPLWCAGLSRFCEPGKQRAARSALSVQMTRGSLITLFVFNQLGTVECMRAFSMHFARCNISRG